MSVNGIGLSPETVLFTVELEIEETKKTLESAINILNNMKPPELEELPPSSLQWHTRGNGNDGYYVDNNKGIITEAVYRNAVRAKSYKEQKTARQNNISELKSHLIELENKKNLLLIEIDVRRRKVSESQPNNVIPVVTPSVISTVGASALPLIVLGLLSVMKK